VDFEVLVFIEVETEKCALLGVRTVNPT